MMNHMLSLTERGLPHTRTLSFFLFEFSSSGQMSVADGLCLRTFSSGQLLNLFSAKKQKSQGGFKFNCMAKPSAPPFPFIMLEKEKYTPPQTIICNPSHAKKQCN
jgi:hypothetical protein